MKKIYLSLLLFLPLSCQKEDNRSVFYEYNGNQPYTITAKVILTEDVDIDFKAMEVNVNANYYHRYGIHINLILDSTNFTLPYNVKNENVIFLPPKQDTLVVYVLPKKYINIISAAGYALSYHNAIIISQEVTNRRTLAHEIGHIYGLDHVNTKDNVMTPLQNPNSKRPNNFEPWQIEKIINEKLR